MSPGRAAQAYQYWHNVDCFTQDGEKGLVDVLSAGAAARVDRHGYSLRSRGQPGKGAGVFEAPVVGVSATEGVDDVRARAT